MSFSPVVAAPLAILLPLLACAACAGSSNTVCRTEIKLEDRQHLMLAPVSVNGTSVPGILDTGAQTSAVTDSLVTRLGLLGDPRHGTLMSGVGGEGQPQNDVLVDRLELAGFDAAQGHYPVIAVPLEAGDKTPLGALIGADLLSHFEVELDIAHDRVVLHDPDRCQGPMPDWQGPVAQVPIEVTWTERILLTVQLDGHDLRALLDSGATVTVVDLPAAEKLGVTADDMAKHPGGEGFGAAGVNFQRVLHRFRLLEVGGQRFEQPTLSILDRPLREADMLLGLDWLRTRRVWISYRRRLLFIAPPIA